MTTESSEFDIPEDQWLSLCEQMGNTRPVRKVCGKPHRSKKSAEYGMKAAKIWGWWYPRIEERSIGGQVEYYVVTGYPLPDVNPENRQGISMPLQGRYRWQGRG